MIVEITNFEDYLNLMNFYQKDVRDADNNLPATPKFIVIDDE